MKRTALISVFDKEGIVDFAQDLQAMDWEILSTGGTYKLLKEQGVKVREVSDLTGFPEVFGGRVKTLNPLIHGGILHRRHIEDDVKRAEELGMPAIDMVVNNLYPFEEMLKKDAPEADMIENIDIGGPSMIRAAAKNFKDVLILTDKLDYDEVIAKLKENAVDYNFRKYLAIKAFNLTAYYDSLVYRYFNQEEDYKFDYFVRGYKFDHELRYGENPHQSAAFYSDEVLRGLQKLDLEQLHGKQISYNNMNDLYGTIKNLREFEKPACICVKHTNPSGIGCGETIDEAFDKAFYCDEISIFGGIIAVNRPVTVHIAEIIHSMFMEIVIAPEFEQEAFDILAQKKNIRLIKCANINEYEFPNIKITDTLNGLLVQDTDTMLYEKLEVVSKRKPTDAELADMIFGYKAIKNATSNGVVLAKDEATVGYGFGEVRRSWAVENALSRSGEKKKGSVLASDAFFFEDTVELLHENGITAAVSPGGSIHDKDVIALCDKYDIALVFTGTRHFKH